MRYFLPILLFFFLPLGLLAQTTNYFFSQNAFPLPEKSAYYQNSMLFFNHFHFGLDEHVSVGIGTAPFSLIEGPLLMTTSLKVAAPLGRNFYGAVNTLLFASVYDGIPTIQLLNQGILTWGNARRNISLGFGGLGFVDASDYAEQTGWQTLGLFLGTEKGNGLVLEFQRITPEEDIVSILTIGYRARIFKKGRFDIGLGVIRDAYKSRDYSEVYMFPFPVLGFSIPLRKKNKQVGQ